MTAKRCDFIHRCVGTPAQVDTVPPSVSISTADSPNGVQTDMLIAFDLEADEDAVLFSCALLEASSIGGPVSGD
eukprot:scaffold154951_cov17-Prasinocladus_malaysianus.AAC.1